MNTKESDTKEFTATSFIPDSKLDIPVPYVSVWDGGTEVTTTATVNIKTGEVTNITAANVSGLDICERQYIVMHGEQVDVYQDEHGYDYWADIHKEYQ